MSDKEKLETEIQIWHNKYLVEHHYATCQEKLVKKAKAELAAKDERIAELEEKLRKVAEAAKAARKAGS